MAKPSTNYVTSFDIFMAILKKEEGGYQNQKEDPGNKNSKGEYVGTNYGISARLYETLIGRPPTEADMRAITPEKAKGIYKTEFWEKVDGANINSQAVANILADHHVNSGSGIKVMQKTLNEKFGFKLKTDNVMGPETLNALNSVDPRKLTGEFIQGRIDYYEGVGNKAYTDSWKERAKRFNFKSNEQFREISPNDSPALKEAKKAAVIADKTIEELVKEDTRIDKLDDAELPAGVTKESLRGEVFKQAKAAGVTKEFDQHVESQIKKANSHKRLLELFADGETKMLDNPGEDNDQLANIFGAWGSTEEMEALIKEFPQYKKSMYVQHSDGKARIRVDRAKTGAGQGYENKSVNKFLTAFNKENQAIFGESYTPIQNEQLKDNWTDNLGSTFTGSLKNISRKLNGKTPIMPGNIRVGDVSKLTTTRPVIDWEKVEDIPKEEEKRDPLKPHVIGGIIADSEANKKGASKDSKKSDGEETTDTAGQFLEREKGILTTLGKGNMEYDKSAYKKELPVDAITGLALGLIGNEQAKNADVPLRTEDVGQAVKSYTAELALRSKEGLPPEVEAAIQSKLAEAYQGGLANIRNASGGNRATVLGNQGTLENAKNRGLVDAQLADFEAKEKAFSQYGEAIQYIDKVRMNREVANTSMKQQRGLQREHEGKQLGSAGFAKMIDGIKYQRENGPGSANHMYKSALMQKMFGFDPGMKDDGTGKTGTRSAHLMKEQERLMKLEKNTELTERYNSLDPEKRKELMKIWDQNPTQSVLAGLVDKFSPEQQAWDQQVAQEAPETFSAATTEEQLAAQDAEQKPKAQAPGGLNTMFGNIPGSILGTEPTPVAPNIDLAAQAQTTLIQPEEMGLAGINANLSARVPKAEVPQNQTPLEMPKFETALAESVNNQMNYYNNQ